MLRKQYVIVILIFLMISGSPCPVQSEEVSLPQRGICAHRGDQAQYPENTLPAFMSAIKMGVQQVELDVCQTRDGHLVIMHDDSVDRTTNGKGLVSSLTLNAIRQLDAGSWKNERFRGTIVPTLEEVLDLFPDDVWINVHVKNDSHHSYEMNRQTVEKTVRILVEKKKTRQAFIMCSRCFVEAARKIEPEILLCNGPGQRTIDQYVEDSIQNHFAFVQPNNSHALTKEHIQKLHQAGIKVNYFGVKGVRHFRQLLELGVDFPLIDDIQQIKKTAGSLGIEPLVHKKLPFDKP